MKFYATTKTISDLSADAVAVFAYQEENKIVYTKELIVLDAAVKGMCKTLLTEEGYKAHLGATFVIQTQGKLPFKKIIVVGLGKENELNAHHLQYAFASLARKAKSSRVTSLVVATKDVYNAVVGLGLGSYSFLIHKNKNIQKEEHEIQGVTFVGDGIMQKDIITAAKVTDATTLARDLVNEPPSSTTPTYLGKIAKKLSGKNITVKIFGINELRKMGMNGLLAVSQGSHEEAKFIKLSYHGGGTKTITLVGKGITYDSGGLSLKPQSGLETMKCDMAGAATIVGIFSVLSKIQPHINIVGLIAACENMPGGRAIKPGDVVRAMNGKTIEIVNTDAEGRIILADALSYAEKFVKSDIVIDIATLTGACVVALGEEIAGLFTDNELVQENLLAAAKQAGEKFWPMPIATEYEEQLKSEIADVRNVSKNRYGGAITGALFLKEFAPKNTSWAHLDIAGPAFAEKDTVLSSYGGTGFGVRTLLTFIEEQARKI